MTERGILFTPENAQKVHDRVKTQTRRIMKPQPPSWVRDFGYTCFTPKGSISGRFARVVGQHRHIARDGMGYIATHLMRLEHRAVVGLVKRLPRYGFDEMISLKDLLAALARRAK